ncbi:MAG: HAD family phosphatase [Patescibacteria group bacterium]
MIKAGIFDIGGVLLRWTNLPLFEDIDQTLLITEEQRNEHWLKYMNLLEVGKITEKEFWEGFIKDTGAKGELPEESLLQRRFKERLTIDEEVLKIPHELKGKGHKIAIISNTITPHAEAMKATTLFSGFDVVVLSNEIGHRKPGNEIFELTLSRLGVAPEESFFVDDLPVNADAASAFGIHGIVFHDRDQLRREITKLGVKI